MTAEREYKAVRIGKPKNPVRTAFLSFWTPKGENSMEDVSNNEEHIISIEIERLKDFKDHPFRVRSDRDIRIRIDD